MAFFGHFGQKSLFLAIFPIFCPVATGLFFPILAKKGQNPQIRLKVPIRESSTRGVLHQPLAPGPCPGISREGQNGGSETPQGGLADFPEIGFPGSPPRSGDRAPARGVDVKPRPPGWSSRLRSPGAGPGTPRGSPEPPLGQGPGSWDPGSRTPDPDPVPDGVSRTPGGPEGLPGPSRGGCFTSTPRAGALRLGAAGYPGTGWGGRPLPPLGVSGPGLPGG